MIPEKNLRNKDAMLRKMNESSEFLKCVLEKMPKCLVYLSNKKSSYTHFHLRILPKIHQVYIFLILLSVSELVP